MKKIKKKIENFIDMLPYFVLQFLPIIMLVVGLYIAYLIAISDLPDWLKFFLLSR